MIGQLRGKIIYKQAPELMLEVYGVGYEIQASMTSFAELPDIGIETTLYTHFIVREDSQTLYGFSSLPERSLFRTLLKVNGVGPKMALAIVSGMTIADFTRYIMADNVTGLCKLPGVGKKTAERLIIEMRDRLPELPSEDTESASNDTVNTPRDNEEEAINALLALGYKPAQASKMVSAVRDKALDVESMIRAALKASLS